MEDQDDYMWDAFVDRIICSKDFEECMHKDGNSNCLAKPPVERCWFKTVCPLNKEREEQ